VATEWAESVIRFRNLSDGTVARDLKGRKGRACALAFSPDGRTLASGTGDGLVQLWPVGDLVQPLTMTATATGAVAPRESRQ
jgi:WD40 repeat protein